MHDDRNCESYVIGDLVEYVGNVYIQDYIYLNEIDMSETGLGLVVKIVNYSPANELNRRYRVYWFKSGACTYISADQMRLAYIKK